MNALRQSFSWWCFANKGVEAKALLAGAAKLGYQGVDLIDEPLWPAARDAGLAITAVGGHNMNVGGLNRREHAKRIEQELRESLAKAVEWKIPVLICFSGNREGLSDAAGLQACVETLKQLAPIAAQAGVVLAMELLNSKVDHADYQCDNSAWGIEMCRQVASPNVKLLYDIYHAQIMEGDIIRTIENGHDQFGHYHTAGNPGRGQPDETQEIYYPAIYCSILKTGYQGYIAHEFIPQSDPLKALERAYRDCEAAGA